MYHRKRREQAHFQAQKHWLLFHFQPRKRKTLSRSCIICSNFLRFIAHQSGEQAMKDLGNWPTRYKLGGSLCLCEFLLLLLLWMSCFIRWSNLFREKRQCQREHGLMIQTIWIFYWRHTSVQLIWKV
ncbi:hypothetical protein D3C74_421030 [compost metagenome]